MDLSHLCRLSMKQMSVCRADISLAGASDSSFMCGANCGQQLDSSVWVAAFPGWRSLLFPSFAVVSQGSGFFLVLFVPHEVPSWQ